MIHPPSLLTVDDVAQFLKVSPNTIYYWVSRSEIPMLRIGKHLRFDRDQILAHFRAKAEQSGKNPACLPARSLLHSPAQSWSLKSDANLADSSKKGISNGNH